MKNSLNTRLKMALLLHSGESGFAIVIAVALGLIMLMVGLTMILRSQNDQTVASTQKQTEQTVAIAEKGVAYYTSFLNSSGLYRRLAAYDDCKNPSTRGVGAACNDPATTTDFGQISWSNARNIPGFATACTWGSSGGQPGIPSSTDWRDVDNPSNTTTPGIRQFRLVSYKYGNNNIAGTGAKALGRLTVEGRITQSPGSNVTKSITKLQVDIPVRDGDIFNVPVPGVWIGGTADDDGTGSSNIDGDVLVNRCFDTANTTDAGNLATMEANIVDPHRARVSDIPLPAMPGEITNIPEREISTVTDDPSTATNERLNPPTPGSGDDSFDSRFDQPGYINLGDITTDITLPDNTQTASPLRAADGRFRMTVSGKEDVHVYRVTGFNNNRTVRIRPGARVALLLYGDIADNVEIRCDSTLAPQSRSAGTNTDYNTAEMNRTPRTCNPMDIMIFGMNTTGQICINGNRKIEGFVFAPGYTVGVAGGGNASPGNFVGAVWANQWRGERGVCPTGGTGGSQTHVVQQGGWNDLPTFARGQVSSQYPPNISPPGTWSKQVAN